MPEQSKVRWSQLKVGVVALCAFAVLFVMVFLLTSSKGGIFQGNALLRTYMDDASGLGDGTAVRVNGITVGKLERLQLTNSPDPKGPLEFDTSMHKEYRPRGPVDS